MSPAELFISEKEGEQQAILDLLHNLLIGFPEMEDKIRYKIPFYYRRSWICYLNPLKDGGVELAFTRANELSNESGILDFKNRKQIAGITINRVEDIPMEEISAVIMEALLLDETVPYNVRKKK